MSMIRRCDNCGRTEEIGTSVPTQWNMQLPGYNPGVLSSPGDLCSECSFLSNAAADMARKRALLEIKERVVTKAVKTDD